MYKFSLFITLLFSFTFSSRVAVSQNNIDSYKSSVEFIVSNLGINVNGTIRGITGQINFDPNAIEKATFTIKIPVKGIRTENQMRDEHLQEEEFFNADKFPDITFVSSAIETANEGYIIKGNLTIKGITKQIETPFSYNDGEFKGSFKIKRSDYNIGEGGFLDTIGVQVTINVKCVLKK